MGREPFLAGRKVRKHDVGIACSSIGSGEMDADNANGDGIHGHLNFALRLHTS
jgi:hypothetical protein